MEQQKLLSECLREHQSLASERAQLTLQQKEVAEAEKKEAQRRQAVNMDPPLTFLCLMKISARWRQSLKQH